MAPDSYPTGGHEHNGGVKHRHPEPGTDIKSTKNTKPEKRILDNGRTDKRGDWTTAPALSFNDSTGTFVSIGLQFPEPAQEPDHQQTAADQPGPILHAADAYDAHVPSISPQRGPPTELEEPR